MQKKGFLVISIVLFLVLNVFSALAYMGCCETLIKYQAMTADTLAEIHAECNDLSGTLYITENGCDDYKTKCCCDLTGSSSSPGTSKGCIGDEYTFHDDITFDNPSDPDQISTCSDACGGVSPCLDKVCGVANDFSQLDVDKCFCSFGVANSTYPWCSSYANQGFDNYLDCFNAHGLAKTHQNIQGTVKKNFQEPIDKATVSIQEISVETNANGNFIISDLSITGDKTLTVVAEGCFLVVKEVVIGGPNIYVTLDCREDVCGNGKVESNYDPNYDEECDRTECLPLNGQIRTCGLPTTNNECKCIQKINNYPSNEGNQSSCLDNISNDGDEYVDGCDAQCWDTLHDYYIGLDPNDNRYLYSALCTTGGCENPEEVGFDEKLGSETFCNDEIDNDCDGLLDFEDYEDCISESNMPTQKTGYTSCYDGADNDNDGAYDVCDVDCSPIGILANINTPLDNYSFLGKHADGNSNLGEKDHCNDGIDNDCDGRIDCHNGIEDNECYCADTEQDSCNDSIDNDGDGKIDCLDSDCNDKNCIGDSGPSDTCNVQNAIDTDEIFGVDTCCSVGQRNDCDNDGQPDTCGPCDIVICPCDSPGSGCEGQICDLYNPNKRCYDNQCQEIAATIVTGIVKTKRGGNLILPGATVIVINEVTGKQHKMTTNVNGGFTFIGLGIGKYLIKITKYAFEDYNSTFELKENERIIDLGDIKLESISTYSITVKVLYKNPGSYDEYLKAPGAEVGLDGKKPTLPINGDFFFWPLEGTHLLQVSAPGFISQIVPLNVPLTGGIKLIYLESAVCTTEKQPPVLESVGIFQGQRKLNLTWKNDCAPDQVTIFRCENNDVTMSQESCTGPWVPINNIKNPEVINYIDDMSIKEDTEYCYKIISDWVDFENIIKAEKESNIICAGPFDDPCLDLIGKFCESKKQPARCNSENRKQLEQECEEDNVFCYGPIENDAYCIYQSPCKKCGTPFGMFGLPIGMASFKNELGVFVASKCEEMQTCYADYTETSVDQYHECINVDSCYDYNGQEACEDSLNINITGKLVGEYNNRCLPRNCSWMPDPRYEEIGEGICMEVDEDLQDCTICDSEDKHNKVFGFCDRERCNLYGDCYWDLNDQGTYLGCTHKRNITCEMYDRKRDCVNITDNDFDLDIIWKNPTTALEDEIKEDGSNEYLNLSQDHLGLGLCVWGVPQGSTERCYKDSDNDRLIKTNSGDCDSLSPTGFLCQKDMVRPETFTKDPILTCAGISCSDPIKIELHVIDEEKTSFGPFKTWFGITQGNEPVYPTYTVDSILDDEFGNLVDLTATKNYTVYYFSEDGSKNLEYEIKKFNVTIDPIPPAYEFSYLAVPYVASIINDKIKWASNLTVSVKLTTENATCNARLLSIGYNLLPGSKQNPVFGNFLGQWQRFYPELLDGNYFYNVSCRDLAGNINTTYYPIKLDADTSVQDAIPNSPPPLNSSTILLGVTTKNAADCAYTTNFSKGDYNEIIGIGNKNKLERVAKNFPEPLDNIVDKYIHTKHLNLGGSGYYDYKIVCVHSGQEGVEVASFVIDLEAPETSSRKVGGLLEHNLQEWKEAHTFALYCDDKKLPDLDGRLVGEPFGCRDTFFCITEPDKNCIPSTLLESSITIKNSSMKRICYKSVDLGGNTEAMICEDVYVDDTPATFEITMTLDNVENYLVSQGADYKVIVDTTEPIDEISLMYSVQKGQSGLDGEIALTAFNSTRYQGNLIISISGIDGGVNNTKWIINSTDLHNVSGKQITKNEFFTIDTSGPEHPEIYFPVNWEGNPNLKYIYYGTNLRITGFAADEEVNQKIRVYVTTSQFDTKAEADQTIPQNNQPIQDLTQDWIYKETTSSLEPTTLLEATLYADSAVNANSIIIEVDDYDYSAMAVDNYLEFENQGALLPDFTFYKITNIKEISGRREVIFEPALTQGIDKDSKVYVHSENSFGGWFSMDVPLELGNNWIYAVGIDALNNLGIRNDASPFLVLSDPNPPMIRIDKPPKAVTPDGIGIIINATIMDTVGINLDSITMTLKKIFLNIRSQSITSEFSCDGSYPGISCEVSNDGTLVRMSYTPENVFTNARYEITVEATDLAGGIAINESWFEIDENVVHNPNLEVEGGFVFNGISYTNNNQAKINISFDDDIGKDVKVSSLELYKEGSEIPITYNKIYPYENIPVDGETEFVINQFENNQDIVIFDYLGASSFSTSFMIPKVIKSIEWANLDVTGLAIDGISPAGIRMDVNAESNIWIHDQPLKSTKENIDFEDPLVRVQKDCSDAIEEMCNISVTFTSTKGQLKIHDLSVKYIMKNSDLIKYGITKFNVTLGETLTEGKYDFVVNASKKLGDEWSKFRIVKPYFFYDNTPPNISIEMDNVSMDTTPKYTIVSDDPVICNYSVDEKDFAVVNVEHDINIERILPKQEIVYDNLTKITGRKEAIINIENPAYMNGSHDLIIKCKNYFDMESSISKSITLVHPKQNRLFYRNGEKMKFKVILKEATEDEIFFDFSEIDSDEGSYSISPFASNLEYLITYTISEDNTREDGDYKVYFKYDGITEPIIVHLHNAIFNFSDKNKASLCGGTPGLFFNEIECKYKVDVQNMEYYKGFPGWIDDNAENDDECTSPFTDLLSINCQSMYYEARNEGDNITQSVDWNDPCYHDSLCMASLDDGTKVYYTKYLASDGTFNVRFEKQGSATKKAYFLRNVDPSKLSISSSSISGCQNVVESSQPNPFISIQAASVTCSTNTDNRFKILFNLDLSHNEDNLNKFIVEYKDLGDDDSGNDNQALLYFGTGAESGLTNSEAGRTQEINGVQYYTYCNDGVDNDLDSGYNIRDNADCLDSDCYGKEVAAGKNCSTPKSNGNLFEDYAAGQCNDKFDNDMDDALILLSTSYPSKINDISNASPENYTPNTGRFYDCYDNDCFSNGADCPKKELVCNDKKNNDYDFGEYGNSVLSLSYQNLTGGLNLTDCFDIDCDGKKGAVFGEDGCLDAECMCEYATIMTCQPGDGCMEDCSPYDTDCCVDDDDKCHLACYGLDNNCPDSEPECGNNIVESPREQCDDNNTLNGDGCNASCQLELTYGQCKDGEERCLDDNSCSENCFVADTEPAGCNHNGTCDVGEGCSCDDCDNTKDSCEGNLLCSIFDTKCCNSALDNYCEKGCSYIDPDCGPAICGNGIEEKGEQCDDNNTINLDGCNSSCVVELVNSPCPETTTLCSNGQCSIKCTSAGTEPADCNHNGTCDVGEGCTCDDCNGEKDTCEANLECSLIDQACCNTISDGECSEEYCQHSDPDCFFGPTCSLGDGCVEGCDTFDTDCCIDGDKKCYEACALDVDTDCLYSECGNGEIEPPREQCDDGDTDEFNGCNTSCQFGLTYGQCKDGEERCLDDNSCSENCFVADTEPAGCNHNGTCDVGEGCSCDDCDNTKDSCEGNLLCSIFDTKCCNSTLDNYCEKECSYIDPDCGPAICGNGIEEKGEQCDDNNTINLDGCNSSCVVELVNSPCPETTTLCSNGQCSIKCTSAGTEPADCNHNGTCDVGEGCTCDDCNGEKDTCEANLECSLIDQACCNTISDNHCNPYCEFSDPDCFSVSTCGSGDGCVEYCDTFDTDCCIDGDNKCYEACSLAIDTDCVSAEGSSPDTYLVNCQDGWDNDFDGDVDCMDTTACWQKGALSTTNPCPKYENNNLSWCFDGENNDYDRGTNLVVGNSTTILTGVDKSWKDCSDYDCKDVSDPDSTKQCPIRETINIDGDESPIQCFDNKDNDLDNSAQNFIVPGPKISYNADDKTVITTNIDCGDIDCNNTKNPYDNSVCEYGHETSCEDNFDNDGDGKVDEDDTDCTTESCYPSPINEAITLDSCANNRNDDVSKDNLIDEDDPDCLGRICAPHSLVDSQYNCVSRIDEDCNNGRDDDGDGDKDCLDSDCFDESHCGTYGKTGVSLPGTIISKTDSSLKKSVNIGAGKIFYYTHISKNGNYKFSFSGETNEGINFWLGGQPSNDDHLNIKQLLGKTDISINDLVSKDLSNLNIKGNDNGYAFTNKVGEGLVTLSEETDYIVVKANGQVGTHEITLGANFGYDDKYEDLIISVMETVKPVYEQTIIHQNPNGFLATVLANDVGTNVYFCDFTLYRRSEAQDVVVLIDSGDEFSTKCVLDFDGKLEYGNYYLEVDIYDGAGNILTKSGKTTNDNDLNFIIEGPKRESIGGDYKGRKYFKNDSLLNYEINFKTDTEFQSDPEGCEVNIYDVKGDIVKTKKFPNIFPNIYVNNKIKCSQEISLIGLEDSYYSFTVKTIDATDKTIITDKMPFWICNWQENPNMLGTFRCRDSCSQNPINISIDTPKDGDVFKYPLIDINGNAEQNSQLELFVNDDFRAQLQLETNVEQTFNFSALALSAGNNTIKIFAKKKGNTGSDSVKVYYNATGPIVNIDISVQGLPANVSIINIDFSITDTDKDGLPDKWEETKGLNPENDEDAESQYNSSLKWLEYYKKTDEFNLDDTIIKLTKQDGNNFVDTSYNKVIDYEKNRIILTFPGALILGTGKYHLIVMSVDQENETGDTAYEIIRYDPDAPWTIFDFVPDKSAQPQITFSGQIINNSKLLEAEFVVIPREGDIPLRRTNIIDTLGPNATFSIPHPVWPGYNSYYIRATAVGIDNEIHEGQNGGVIIIDLEFEGVDGEKTKLIAKKEQSSMVNVYEQRYGGSGFSNKGIDLGAESSLNCGNNINCFSNAAKTCKRSKVTFHSIENDNGVLIRQTKLLKIIDESESQCRYTEKISNAWAEYNESLKIDISLSDGIDVLLSKEMERNETESDKNGGRRECLRSKPELSKMLLRWEAGNYTQSDYVTCKECIPVTLRINESIIIDNKNIVLNKIESDSINLTIEGSNVSFSSMQQMSVSGIDIKNLGTKSNRAVIEINCEI